MLGLIDTSDSTSQLLKDSGATKKDLIAAIKELRKGSKVTSQSQEETYNALNKYAKNLNQLAKENKLDPVIGRDEEIRRVLQILSRRTELPVRRTSRFQSLRGNWFRSHHPWSRRWQLRRKAQYPSPYQICPDKSQSGKARRRPSDTRNEPYGQDLSGQP